MKPYMPSNGTEGDSFEAEYCKQCTKDSTVRGGDKECPILTKAILGEQPEQWVYYKDEDTEYPICLNFKPLNNKQL